jgi:hypothetical protein
VRRVVNLAIFEHHVVDANVAEVGVTTHAEKAYFHRLLVENGEVRRGKLPLVALIVLQLCDSGTVHH